MGTHDGCTLRKKGRHSLPSCGSRDFSVPVSGACRGETMCAKIHYETPDGIDVIDRDEYHNEKDGFVVSYDYVDDGELVNKATIPKERIVRIDG